MRKNGGLSTAKHEKNREKRAGKEGKEKKFTKIRSTNATYGNTCATCSSCAIPTKWSAHSIQRNAARRRNLFPVRQINFDERLRRKAHARTSRAVAFNYYSYSRRCEINDIFFFLFEKSASKLLRFYDVPRIFVNQRPPNCMALQPPKLVFQVRIGAIIM